MFDLPIVVVKGRDSTLDFFDDDLLRFSNNRVCFGAVNALQILEDAPANVVITELNVGDMSGVELAEAIRDIDEERNHFTYIILIGAVNHERVQQEDFHRVIDAITGTKRVDVLEHLALAGARISREVNRLRSSNNSLQNLCNDLRKGQLLDPLTGLGNREFADNSLSDTIRQVESRGGAVCLVMISVSNYEDIKQNYDTSIAGELVVSISERIQNLVRPLDVVTYFSPGLFALILMQPSIDQCTAKCYERIFDGIRLKSYTTTAGYQPVTIGMSICAATADTGAPNHETMIDFASKNLAESIRTEAIVVHHITPE
ncbi:MAG: diguanylate cyclase [Gammaproteobacteria bacterium]|jgi:phosphoserine phosphatase RsbU/P|nr:diguanylate cyclase [Gammaproteobacteria bacterium]